MEQEIRVVAIDLDGTLLTDGKRVSGRTTKALRCLPSRDVRVVIASARPPRSVRGIYQGLNLQTWQVNYNGALIWDEPNQTIIDHVPLPREMALEMITRARELFPQVLVSCEILDCWYTDREDNTYTTETGRLFEPDIIAPVEVFCQMDVTKLLLLGEAAMISQLQQILSREFPLASVVRSDPELIQVMNAGVSKASALRRVVEHYGCEMRQVLAIGDAVNDIEMIREAGIGVAMDNAHPLVKAAAHWVAPSNNDHGVHAALRRYGLCD